MDLFSRMAERKIQEAIERGELEGLPGAGKPLVLDDLSHVPEELRAGYIMLKNAGVVPEEVHLAKENVDLQALLRMCRSDGERAELKRKLTEKRLRLRMLMERRGLPGGGVWDEYGDKVQQKLEGEES